MSRWLASTSVVTALVAAVSAGMLSARTSEAQSGKTAASQMVDSGSFGVMVRGQRVMTESFTVLEDKGISRVNSQLQEAGNSPGIHQKSELEMNPGGELIRYDWSDGSGSLLVTPKDEFLLEKISASPSAKPAEQPFLMPNTSAILDNNFFIQREILAWRYLATNCKSDNGNLKCQQGPVEFGVLVPQDRTSMRVRMELVGREKLMIRGAERELLRLNLTGEAFSWALWLDDKDHFKVVRVLIPDDNTEVLRD
jgi:hypothetical protein